MCDQAIASATSAIAGQSGKKFVRADKLQTWLAANNARRLWFQQSEGLTVTGYSILGQFVIVTVFAGRNRAGWELYVPASKSNDVATTLDAAAAAIGDGCKGAEVLAPADNGPIVAIVAGW